MKTLFLTVFALTTTSAFASGGVSCFSPDKKLRFDIVESSDRTPVSAKLYYKTDAVDGEDGSVQSFDLRNSKTEKVITYSESLDYQVIVIQKNDSVVAAKIIREMSVGTAQVMIQNEVRTLSLSCIFE